MLRRIYELEQDKGSKAPHMDKDTYLFDKIFERLNNENIDEGVQDEALDRAMMNLPEWIRERSDEDAD